MAKQKEYFRINEQIKAPFIRIVGDNIESKIVDIKTGIKMSDDMGLDLVEISPTANPPVCKIIEYQKFVYDRKRQQKLNEQKQIKIKTKEIRFTPTTGEHDYTFKMKQAIEFLQDKNKVKINIVFKGRMINYMEYGTSIIEKLLEDLKEYGKPESDVKLEGKKLMVIFQPK